RIGPAFKALPAARVGPLRSNIADFICENTGGPCSYLGRTMKESHKGLGLAREDFDACNAALAKALDSSKVAPGDKAEVMKLVQSGLAPKNIRSTDDLARLPVIKKSAMPDLQKADPPFGGFCTVPLAKIRKIFVSPGPIFEPMGPEVSGFHAETGLFAGGFRPGDIVINTFSYHLTPAAHEIDESLNLIGCSVVPTGAGQTESQVRVTNATG